MNLGEFTYGWHFKGMSLDGITENVGIKTGVVGARGLSPKALQHGEGEPAKHQPTSRKRCGQWRGVPGR